MLISYLGHRTDDSPNEPTQRRKNVPRVFTSNEPRVKRDPAGKHTELSTKKSSRAWITSFINNAERINIFVE